MEPNERFSRLASESSLQKAAAALRANGMTVFLVGKGEAKPKVLELIPIGAEVLTMTSVTLDTIGLPPVLNDAAKYDAIRPKLLQMDPKSQAAEIRKLASAPDYVIGSVHAVTEDGHVLIASNSGSQLATYVYTAGKVIWVAGAQKVVKDDEEAKRRIHEYSFPLEDARARQAYGVGSGVNKLLILQKEIQPGRITVILVKEKLGF